MSDIKLYSIKDNLELKARDLQTFDIEKILLSFGEALFGIKIIKTNYIIDASNNNIIFALGIDENKQLVVIENRLAKVNATIGKGLMQIDYISDHESEFKLLLRDLSFNQHEVIYNARLLVIGDDFNIYDSYAINRLPYPIELIKVKLLEKDLLFISKTFVNKRTQYFNFAISKDCENLFMDILDFIYSLGDDVVGFAKGDQFNFRKIKNFLNLSFKNQEIILTYQVNNINKTSIIKNSQDLLALEFVLIGVYNES